MQKLYLLMLLCAALTNIHAQTFQWAKREGLWAYDYGYGITTDNSSNVYVTGKYEENSIFSGTTVSCEGNHDVFIVSYSNSGSLRWVKTAGGEDGDYGTSISCDNMHIYVAGEIEGWGEPVKFENSTLMAEGANDIFLAKYDLDGNLKWVRRAGSIHNEKALGVAHDKNGNIYIAGLFNKQAKFEHITITGWDKNDIFLAKYDANGNILWVRKAGSMGRDEAKGVAVDAAGNVYMAGMYSDGCKFENHTLNSPNGNFNLFLAKYDQSGNLQWVRSAGENWDDVSWGVAIDNSGKIYIAGEIVGYVDFGGGLPPVVTSGMTDIFVACYDQAGNPLWAKKAGGDDVERARGIGTDGYNIYITGQFGGTAHFGNYSLAAVDTFDVFTAAIDNSGNWLWALSVGGPPDVDENLGYESGTAITADAGGVYATGAILTGGVFGNISYNAYDRTDIFVTKISYLGVDVQENFSLSKDVSIHPNPSNGRFYVSGYGEKVNAVKVYNMVGELVYSIRPAVSEEYSLIDISNKPKGLYFIEISTKYDRETRKIIIE